MAQNKMWEKSPEEIKAAVEEAKERLFPWDWRNSAEMQDADFRSEYYTNLNKGRE